MGAACALALGTSVVVGCGSSSNGLFGDAGDGGNGGGQDGARDGTVTTDARSLLPGADSGQVKSTLALAPTSASLTVTSVVAPPTQLFTATLTTGASHKTVTPTFTLDDYTLGSITAAGVFTPAGTVAGTVHVTATYAGLTATAKLTIAVKLTSSLTDVTLPDGTVIANNSSAITAGDQTALQGPPGAVDGGTPTAIVYPYDQTVFPLGLLAPVVQFSPGSVAPVDFKISLDTTGFHWDGFGHVGNPAALLAAIPQSIWDGALETAATGPTGTQVTLSVVKAAGGVAYGPPATSHLIVANGKLTGVIYYESYSTDPIDAGADAAGATDFGLWAVKPGQSKPPSHLQPGCVICHGVSASGNTLTNGTDDPTVGASTGVYRVEADGGYTHLATAPANLPYAITGIDSRGLGWGTVSPDGKVILRGLSHFWGGDALLAWATPSQPLLEGGVVQPLSTTMTVSGDFNMFVPQYSVDGKHLVYVTATNAADAGAPGTPSKSIGVVDIATSLTDGGAGPSFGSVTLSSPRLAYDSTAATGDAGGGRAFTKVPTFLPDSKSIVFEETLGGAGTAGYNNMLPDYTGVDGELAMLQPTPGGGYVRVALTNANASVDPNGVNHNFEPKPLPVSVGGYYWVVFASLRKDAYPELGAPKKLWVTAISPGATPGKDASHPPFTLVNQAIVAPQQSQRAYWALSPCLGAGASCQTSSDCCDGSCIPQSSTDPTSPLVCRTPTATACVPLGGRCTAGQSQECCNAAAGVTCIGTLNGFGTCEAPGAPP